MIKILRIIFSTVTILVAAYGIIVRDSQSIPIMVFFTGLTVLVTGLNEFKQERKAVGWLLVSTSIFCIIVCMHILWLSVSVDFGEVR